MNEAGMKKPFVQPLIRKISLTSTNKFTGPYLKVKVSSEVEGHPVGHLVRTFGSPLYVVVEKALVGAYARMHNAFAGRYPGAVIAYSYKTNYLSAICAILHKHGAWAEIVSGFEYEIARRLGVPGERIVFNGPYKTRADLARAFGDGAMVNLDSFDDLVRAETLAKEMGVKAKVGIRVNMRLNLPAWDKFGFSLEEGQAYEACRTIATSNHLQLSGLHCHVGTFIIDLGVYRKLSENLVALALNAQATLGAHIRYLDVGGGFASKNTLHTQLMPGDTASPSPDQYAEAVCQPLTDRLDEFKSPPLLLLEPGRSVVDECMLLLATVVAIKNQPQRGRAVIIDAGVNLLPTAFYYKHDLAVDRDPSRINEEVDIYGPLCMQIDVVRKGATLPHIQTGDILTIKNVGAYNFSQSMQFIFPRPAVVLVSGADVDVIRAAETYDDIKRLEQVPARITNR